jgi:hypothetical protein
LTRSCTQGTADVPRKDYESRLASSYKDERVSSKLVPRANEQHDQGHVHDQARRDYKGELGIDAGGTNGVR